MNNRDVDELRTMLMQLVDLKIKSLTTENLEEQFQTRMQYLRLTSVTRQLETKIAQTLAIP